VGHSSNYNRLYRIYLLVTNKEPVFLKKKVKNHIKRSRDDIGRSSSYNNISSYSPRYSSDAGSLSLSSLKLESDRRLDSPSYSSLRRRASKAALPPIDHVVRVSDRYTSSIPKPSSGSDSYTRSALLGESSTSSRVSRTRYGRSGDSTVEKPTESKKQGGLRNIGNSCYLNSVIQCILHCEPLKQYLISGRHKSEINSRSKARGRVAESSADLFKSLLSGQTASPSAVKSAVQSTSGLFRGTAQEDAQEFLRWYLEGTICFL